MKLRMAYQAATAQRVVLVCDDDDSMLATIYPTDDGSNRIHIVSRHFADQPVEESVGAVPGYTMKFRKKSEGGAV